MLFLVAFHFGCRQSTDAGREEMEVETNRLRRELNTRCRELEAEKQAREEGWCTGHRPFAVPGDWA